MSETSDASVTTSPTAPSSSTSLFSPSFSDPIPSPTGNSGDQDSNDSLQSSAALYLYTFLATLILLLGVSAAIVIRSLVLRRRHRRMIEEAIANGTWVPPPARNRYDASSKPVMHEAHIHIDDKPQLLDGWDGLKPFSAQYTVLPPWLVSSLFKGNKSPVPPPQPRFFGNLFRRRASNRSQTEAMAMNSVSTPGTSTPNVTLNGAPKVNVAVLIAMPREKGKETDDESLPLLQVGVAEVPVIGDEGEDDTGSLGPGTSNAARKRIETDE